MSVSIGGDVLRYHLFRLCFDELKSVYAWCIMDGDDIVSYLSDLGLVVKDGTCLA